MAIPEAPSVTDTTSTARPDTVRRSERRERQRVAAVRPAMQQIDYQIPRYNLLPESGVQRIHDESMRILRDLGIDDSPSG